MLWLAAGRERLAPAPLARRGESLLDDIPFFLYSHLTDVARRARPYGSQASLPEMHRRE